ncbi:hypothetical protein GJAV_G00254480 [Gymnothorax javanicus]|nr:hypothetical protein GJAV_G00254480 [Gymnothorax javanicus]
MESNARPTYVSSSAICATWMRSSSDSSSDVTGYKLKKMHAGSIFASLEVLLYAGVLFASVQVKEGQTGCGGESLVKE